MANPNYIVPGGILLCVLITSCQSQAEHVRKRSLALDEDSKTYARCDNPMIVVHQSSGDASYSTEERLKAMRIRGYDIVIESDPNPCADPAISEFILGFQAPDGTANVASLYTRHLSKSQALNDPELKCNLIRTATSDGQGRVTFTAAGYDCEKRSSNSE